MDIQNINAIMSMFISSNWLQLSVHEKTFEIFTDASINAESIGEPCMGFASGNKE